MTLHQNASGDVHVAENQCGTLMASASVSRQQILIDGEPSVLRAQTIDYKQTPKISDEISHTLTHEGRGGIHSAVAYAEPMVMASAHTNAEIGEGITPALMAHAEKQAPIVIDRAAFNQGGAALYAPHIERTDVMDTIVARGPHAVGYSQATARSTSGPSAPETSRASGASTSTTGR